MNQPEVIVIIMSVVVLSLVHLRSFLSFRFGGFEEGSRIVCTENKKEKNWRKKRVGAVHTIKFRKQNKTKL